MKNCKPVSDSEIKRLNAVVLVVDDNPTTTEFLVHTLSPHYRTFSAHSGEDAIGFCAIHAPDLVVLDLHMPILDGLLTCKILKSIPSMINCPIVFSTADTSIEQEIKCWDAGATDFVCKPIVVQTLVKRIREHILAKMQHDLIENMVFIDPQTNLYNKRFFYDCYDKQISLAKRNDEPLTLVIFELKACDVFEKQQKSVITTRYLSALSQLILDKLDRPTDALFRYSENKFIVLLPDTYIFSAKHFIQKVLSAVTNMQSITEVLSFKKIKITAGMASVEALQKNSNLIELAEKNLTQNKQLSNTFLSLYYDA
jgi:diguanylate cyclase (GGDEF)-like protein